MKIIYLLNKIANGEEVPKRIKIKDDYYHFDTDDSDYYNDTDGKATLMENIYLHNAYVWFNLEVEILEEEKKIPEKLPFENGKISDNEFLAKYITHNRNTINKIIDYLDYLKSKGDE